MRCRWTNHPSDKNLNGIEFHTSRAAAEVLCALQQAVISPYRGYVDFLSSTAREGRDDNNVNPPQVSGVEWSCGALPTSGRPVIWRKQGGETARIEDEQQAIQYGAPENVVQEFRRLLAVLTGAVNAAEAARPEQVRREIEDKAGVWQTIFRRA